MSSSLLNIYNEFNSQKAIKNSIFLSGVPWKIIGTIVFYILMILYSFYWMRNRRAFRMNKIVMIYNGMMSLLNVAVIFFCFWMTNYDLKILSIRLSEDDNANYTQGVSVNVMELLLITKFLDFLDTFILILRKKTNQLTSFHFFHHALTPILGYFLYMVIFKLPIFMTIIVYNLGEHVLLYTYYFLYELGYCNHRFKKLISFYQLFQFIAPVIISPYCIANKCVSIPISLQLVFTIVMSTYLYLYIQSTRRTKLNLSGKSID